MKNLLTILIVFSYCIFTATNVLAQNEERVSKTEPISPSDNFNHAINMCPGGVIFGIYSANFEYLFSKPHGIVVRFDYEAVPKTYTDASIESSGIGFTLNYRWHLSEKLESVFLGVFTRYKIYKGNGSQELTEFDFTLSEMALGVNAGKRWVWDNGINVNFALGYGISTDWQNLDPTTSSIESTFEIFKDEYDFLGPFYGELSIGYAF